MAPDPFSDLSIKYTDHHHDDQNYSPFIFLSQHYHSIQDQITTKNRKIQVHLQLLLKQEEYKLQKFIVKYPFPDNNCKLTFLKALKYDGSLLEFASEELRDDEMIVLTAIQHDPASIQFASDRFKKNREFVLKVVKMKGRYLVDIPFEHVPDFHNDDEIARLAIEQQPMSLKFVSERLKNDRNILLKAVKMDGNVLEFIPQELMDRELVLEAVKNYRIQCPLRFTPAEFGDDEEIMLTAAKCIGFDSSKMSNRLRSNKEFMLKLLKINGKSLKEASDELKSDREIVLQAVKSDATSLQYANPKFQSDRELVTISASHQHVFYNYGVGMENDRELIFNVISSPLSLVYFIQQSGSLLVNDTEFINQLIDVQCNYSEQMEYVSQMLSIFTTPQKERIVRIDPKAIHFFAELKNKRELVLDYILQDQKILESLNDKLRNDREIIKLAIKVHRGALKYASAELQNDRSFVMEAVFYDTSNFSFASNTMKRDVNILKLAIAKNGYYIAYAPESWRNRDICLGIVRNLSANIVNYLGSKLKEDRALILEISRITASLENLPQEFKQDREIVLSVIEKNGNEFIHAPHSLRSDRKLLLIAIRNGFSLKHLNKSEMDREIVYEACRYDGNNLVFAPEKYRDDEHIILTALQYTENSTEFFEVISERLKNDVDFIRKMAKINGSIVQYLPKSFKNDKQVILNALPHGENVLSLASEELRNDKEVVLTALQYDSDCYKAISDEMKEDEEVLLSLRRWLPTQYVNSSLIIDKDMALLLLKQTSLRSYDFTFKDNRQFALLAVNTTIKNLQYVSNRLKLDRSFILEIEPKDYDILFIHIELREDREIALKSLERNGKSIMYLSEKLKNEFKNNRQIMLKAIKSNSIAFLFASKKLQNEELFIQEAISLNGRVLRYLPQEYNLKKEIVLKCVKNNGFAFLNGCLNPKFWNDREIILSSVSHKNSSAFFRFASYELRSDKEVVLKAIESDFNSLLFATPEIIKDEEFIFKAVDVNIECLAFAHYSLRYNTQFLKRVNKDNRIVLMGSKKLKRSIDFDVLLDTALDLNK